MAWDRGVSFLAHIIWKIFGRGWALGLFWGFLDVWMRNTLVLTPLSKQTAMKYPGWRKKNNSKRVVRRGALQYIFISSFQKSSYTHFRTTRPMAMLLPLEHFVTLARNYLETWMPSHKTTSARGKTMNLPEFQATNPNFLPFWLQEIDVLHLPFWGSKLPIPSQSSPTTTRQSGARSQGDRVVPCASSSRSSWRLSRERDRSADGVWDSHVFFLCYIIVYMYAICINIRI